MDGSDALMESCERLRRLAGNAETALQGMRMHATLRFAVAVSMLVTALLGCVVALALTGLVSAVLGGARRAPAIGRLILGGGAAMALTYLLGHAIGGSQL